jgi:hypothetical protein
MGLIYDLVVEGTEPALVAAERGTSRPALTEQLRDAIDQLALEHEHAAYGESDQERVRGALARRPLRHLNLHVLREALSRLLRQEWERRPPPDLKASSEREAACTVMPSVDAY